MGKFHSLLDAYCYGPVELLKIWKGDSTMWLSLRDSAGRLSEAIYRGCVYWNLDQEGIRLPLVQKVSSQELIRHSPVMKELKKNAMDVPHLLQEWERLGLSFYLHLGGSPGEEYLVAARTMEYREIP